MKIKAHQNSAIKKNKGAILVQSLYLCIKNEQLNIGGGLNVI